MFNTKKATHLLWLVREYNALKDNSSVSEIRNYLGDMAQIMLNMSMSFNFIQLDSIHN